MVVLYILMGALTVVAAQNPARVAEWGGVFPLGVLIDPWAGAFLSLLWVISGSVYV